MVHPLESDDGCETSAANEVIVSVVMPVYNACAVLPTSLAGIRNRLSSVSNH